jgi:hypothetical protein
VHLLLAFVGLQAAGAQERAVLRSGPAAVRGIPYFPANVLSAYRGEYRLDPPAGEEGAAGTSEVTVFHTEATLVLPQEWPPQRCGRLGLLRVTGEEAYTVCYRDSRGYTLFFSFVPGEPPDGSCRFVEGFVRRFQALLGFADPQYGPPFPAVLDLDRK